MTSLIAAAALLVAAVLIAVAMGAVKTIRETLAVSREVGVEWRAAVTDDEKEALSRRMSVRLGGLFLRIVAALAAAAGLPFAALWAGDRLGLVSLDRTLATLASPSFLIGSTIAGFAAVWLARRPGGAAQAEPADGWMHNYSATDRALHRLAFATWPIQAALADMEPALYGDRLKDIVIDRPVFVAGLPRAGTTLILRLIETTGAFASYRYRDMPFLLTPMLWAQLSGPGRADLAPRPRAHDDGMDIDIDSAEAFEEVVWRTHHPDRYRGATLPVWPRKTDPEFKAFFALQMRKIIALRREEQPGASRYLSKNNGNIARLAAIGRIAPDAVIIVPYRDPVAQAASLHRQHLNFLELHGRDAFSKRYMEAIGHYDLGANLKPIAFLGSEADAGSRDYTQLEAWLDYWCDAYGYLADLTEPKLWFASYDALCAEPQSALGELASVLGLGDREALMGQAHTIRPAGPAQDQLADPERRARAQRIFQALEARRAAQARP
jgi:hypothetical protein